VFNRVAKTDTQNYLCIYNIIINKQFIIYKQCFYNTSCFICVKCWKPLYKRPSHVEAPMWFSIVLLKKKYIFLVGTILFSRISLITEEKIEKLSCTKKLQLFQN